MTKTVYVPLDGSERAESALRPAAAIASRAAADLVLVTARWLDVDAARNYLDAQVARLVKGARPWLILDRDPADAILLAASADDALVCMATRGRGAAREAVLGSVAEDVVRSSRTPIALVGPGIRSGWGLGAQPLVYAGLDGSAWSRCAARAAGVLATSLGGRVRAVEVLRPSDVTDAGDFPEADVDLLERAVAELSSDGIPADYALVDAFDAADALVREAESHGAAFISVASHGRSGVGRVVLGSVAMRTVRRAPCPVLVSGPRARVCEADVAGGTARNV